MSLISRLKAVVAGEDYLDDDFDEFDYATEDELNSLNLQKQSNKSSNALSNGNPFDFINNRNSKVVGMPGISSTSSEVTLMEPRTSGKTIDVEHEKVVIKCLKMVSDY